MTEEPSPFDHGGVDREGVPNPWTVHAGNPVLHGTKYVITKWYRCRKWRQTTPATLSS